MLQNKVQLLIIFTSFLITVYLLFTVKDRVNSLQMEVKEVKKQIANEQDSIHVLKAEFSYLTSPKRLNRLAAKHLDLKETSLAQMTNDPTINRDKTTTAKKFVSTKLVRHNVKWRYKKDSKYITKVSAHASAVQR